MSDELTTKPNIIWLTLDSVRQDHTTMDGYHRETTPNIQAIADHDDGIAFGSCFSHARASATSIPSILSGTYPSRHRTYYQDRAAFPDELPLVAELLADEGYTMQRCRTTAMRVRLQGLTADSMSSLFRVDTSRNSSECWDSNYNEISPKHPPALGWIRDGFPRPLWCLSR